MSGAVSLSGSFSSMSMADLIQWARTARRSGVITARSSSQSAERRIFLQDGRIIACASNDPRDYYGNYLVRLGHCTEEDVDKALRIQRETGIMVGAILVMVEKITSELAVATLTYKTFDIICDIFLWSEGSFGYEEGSFPASKLVSISIDPIAIALEGTRRVDGWNALRTRIHPGAIFEPTGAPPPADMNDGGRGIGRYALPLLDGHRNVEEVMESLPFSRYAILESIWSLVAAGSARPGDVTAAPNRRKRLEMNLAEAVSAGQRGDWGKAVQILEGLHALSPDLPGLSEELGRCGDRLKKEIYESIHPGDVPVVAIGVEALERLSLSTADGFVVSRMDGRSSIADIVRISPLPELDALRSIKRLLGAKVIDFPSRLRT